ncbi:MAG: energy-coupling factor transport system permease protein [Thermoleophilaceae bacterium]|nr:energy-coupling factor transport system permease protein [Thermoleophilaceae bacterium]
MRLVPVYRPGSSALHSARAGVASAYCGALGLVAVLYEHPLVIAAVVVATVSAGAAAGVGTEMRRGLRLALPIALLVAVLNPLFASSQGVTLLVRGDDVLGHRVGDITLEALVYGAAAGLRFAALVLVFALYSAVVDPDDMLKLLRRVSYRSALTASLTTRLVPVLARDASRMSDAARCRPHPPGRAARARAALHGALDRAVDVAAALEVRGYGDARRPQRAHTPWSRHDVRVAVAATGMALLAVLARIVGGAGFEPYPRIDLALGPAEVGLATVVVALALAPLAGTRSRLGVARAA